MADGIDVSLDELIRRSVAGNRRRSPDHGPNRRSTVQKPARTAPYATTQARQMWQRRMVETVLSDDSALKAENGTKLYLSNLDYGVSNGDIKLLFSEEGELKRYCIHYDKSGRSKGTAEVVFARQSDALAAIKKYNNVKLDGKPLQIELVGTSYDTPVAVPLSQNGLLRRPNHDFLVSGPARVGGRGFREDHTQMVSFRDLNHDLKRYQRGGHTGVKGHTGKVTAKDLDDDLDRYHLEAEQFKKDEKGDND